MVHGFGDLLVRVLHQRPDVGAVGDHADRPVYEAVVVHVDRYPVVLGLEDEGQADSLARQRFCGKICSNNKNYVSFKLEGRTFSTLVCMFIVRL